MNLKQLFEKLSSEINPEDGEVVGTYLAIRHDDNTTTGIEIERTDIKIITSKKKELKVE